MRLSLSVQQCVQHQVRTQEYEFMASLVPKTVKAMQKHGIELGDLMSQSLKVGRDSSSFANLADAYLYNAHPLFEGLIRDFYAKRNWNMAGCYQDPDDRKKIDIWLAESVVVAATFTPNIKYSKGRIAFRRQIGKNVPDCLWTPSYRPGNPHYGRAAAV